MGGLPSMENKVTIPSCRDWLGSSVLSQSADAYVGYLQHQRYGAATVRAYLHSVEHFAHWLTRQRLCLGSIDELLVRRFITKHLPTCGCKEPCQRSVTSVRPALVHLLHVLREEDGIAEPRWPSPKPIALELERFDAHLDATCGLAFATRVSRRMWVGKFLRERFGAGPIQFERLKPSDIADFMIRPGDHYKPGTHRAIACALHSYLRFRALSTGDPVELLTAAIPRTAQWRLAALPSHLTPEEVTRFLDAFDRHSAGGKRDYAMARCFLDMGLRAGEVAAIQLDDLDWREGTLAIGHSKSRRVDVLPLPVPTGNAIVQYLRHGRPPSTSRALFLRHRAPFNTPITTELARGAVRRAYVRCGLADRYTGTHVLRRTAAVRMRCAGATLKEIADVLRHRSLDTTTIYSKVDVPTLSAVAAPWPGAQL